LGEYDVFGSLKFWHLICEQITIFHLNHYFQGISWSGFINQKCIHKSDWWL